MNRLILSILFGLGLVFASSGANAATKPCHFSDMTALKTHLENHVKYPITGKALKMACKKEMPKEFSATERSCMEKHISNKAEYNSSSDVMKDLGV